MPVAEFVLTNAWLVIAIPAVGALVLLLGGGRADRWGHWLATAMCGLSAVCAALLLVALLGRGEDARTSRLALFDWMSLGSFEINAGLLVDPLSVSFLLLITGVGALIHLYSVGYMREDQRRRRFFGFLNLFMVAMLLLVLADNYVLLYIGWEGVGLASYLLIGFWQHKPAAATAAKKAFIVNRVGDLGLLIAVLTMFAVFGSAGFAEVFGAAGTAGTTATTVIGLLLLLGACGKSAQVPLQSWLLDAMEGPTPVSALIHAATMVTAGVYLIVRSHAIFDAAPAAQLAVVVVGLLTMLVGAIIGCAKHDIKQALAASTMSQIGYMIMAAGLGAAGYVAAILHLLTHGFFKAGLFLGAGSVMHGMDGEVDMRHYGGLGRFMPVTFITFGISYLAIIGVPPFAGFYSKDQIIEVAFAAGGVQGWVFGSAAVLGAGLTAFYMTRVVVLTFFGSRRWRGDAEPHESPTVMLLPMILLGVGSAGAGLLLAGSLREWLAPALGAPSAGHDAGLAEWQVTVIVSLAVAIGFVAAVATHAGQAVIRRLEDARTASRITIAARNDLYGDAINEALFSRQGGRITAAAAWVERACIDRAVAGVGELVHGVGQVVRRTHTGFARSYALFMMAGTVAVVGAMLLVGWRSQ